MVLIELVDGRKGPGDVLALVKAYGEPLSLAEWLFLGKCYLDSEASYYPVSEGYVGPCMLLEAIVELSHGVKFEMVVKKFGLSRKGKFLKVIDKRKSRDAAVYGKAREGFAKKGVQYASQTVEEG